jgi:hypothetical protein
MKRCSVSRLLRCTAVILCALAVAASFFSCPQPTDTAPLESSTTVTTLAEKARAIGSDDSGSILEGRFHTPYGITTDGTNLFLADSNNQTIRVIVISGAAVGTLAGTAGAPGASRPMASTFASQIALIIRSVWPQSSAALSKSARRHKGRKKMKTWKLVLLLAVLFFLGSCVTTAKYSPTKESSEDYRISYTDEARQ